MDAFEAMKAQTAPCGVCGSLSSHLRDCPRGTSTGHGVGQRRRRSVGEQERWKYLQRRCRDRDRDRCRLCGDYWPTLDVHHVETVQTVFARGGSWVDADRLANLIALCRACHGWIHSAAGIDEARAEGWIIDAETKRKEQTK